MKKWLKITKVFVLVFMFSLIIKIFVFEIYHIPSTSMENTIKKGDIILISKISYGIRTINITRNIKWLNPLSIFKPQSNNSFRSNSKKKAFQGYSKKIFFRSQKIKNDDIIVYNRSYDQTITYVKRCVAISSDTLIMRNDSIFINGKLSKSIQGIRKSNNNLANCAACAFPWSPKFKWSLNSFGPIIIPYKGMQIALNDSSIALYRNIIKLYEKSNIYKIGSTFYCENKAKNTYTFKKNYVFLVGDNRLDSFDSRFWGFLCTDQVLGKVKIILFSTNIKNLMKTNFNK